MTDEVAIRVEYDGPIMTVTRISRCAERSRSAVALYT